MLAMHEAQTCPSATGPPAAGLPASASVKVWRAPIWEPTAYATNFDTFRGRRAAPKQPLPQVTPCDDCVPIPAGIDPGAIPAADEWHAALRDAAAEGFAGTPVAGTPVSEPDARLRAEKGGHWEGLQDLLEGGEAAFVALLGAYLAGAPLPRAEPQHALSVRMLQAAAELEQVPGNASGGPPTLCRCSRREHDCGGVRPAQHQARRRHSRPRAALNACV